MCSYIIVYMYIQRHNKCEYASHIQANILYIFWSCMSGMNPTLHTGTIHNHHLASWISLYTQAPFFTVPSEKKKKKHLPIPSPPSANVRYLGLNHGRPGCHPDQRWNYSLLCRSWPHQTSSWPSVPGATRRTEHPLLGEMVGPMVVGCQQEIQHLKQRKNTWDDSADVSFKDPNIEKIFRRGHQQYQGNLIRTLQISRLSRNLFRPKQLDEDVSPLHQLFFTDGSAECKRNFSECF